MTYKPPKFVDESTGVGLDNKDFIDDAVWLLSNIEFVATGDILSDAVLLIVLM